MVEQTGTHMFHSGGPWCCAHCPHTLGSPHFAKNHTRRLGRAVYPVVVSRFPHSHETQKITRGEPVDVRVEGTERILKIQATERRILQKTPSHDTGVVEREEQEERVREESL